MNAPHSLKLASLMLLAFCVAAPEAQAQRDRRGEKKEEREENERGFRLFERQRS